MKKLLTLILLLYSGPFAIAQSNYEQRTIKVLSSSHLTITGETNISAFTCVFDTSLLADPIQVQYLETGSFIAFQNAKLDLDKKGFDCGSRPINQDFRALVKADQYPEIELELLTIQLNSPASGIATIRIKIAGIEKNYPVPVKINSGEIVGFQGSMEINIEHFDLEPPRKLFGIIVVKEEIQILFDLRVKRHPAPPNL